MPLGRLQAGVGIGPLGDGTRPNGLAVVGADALDVTLLGPLGAAAVRPALPRLVLGPFTFGLNPSGNIPVSERPLLAKHVPPGGSPRYQFMGRDETRITLRGTLSGAAALADLAALRALNGTRQPLSYGPISAAQCWLAVDWTFVREDHIDYAIALAVEGEPLLDAAAGGSTTSSPAQAEGQAATGNPSGQAPPTVEYVVVQGDTLWGIAQAKYGDGGLFPVIARLNGIDDPRELAVGSTLQLPSDRAAALALKAKQDAEIAAMPSDGGVGVPLAAYGQPAFG
jgi:LysM repeat protein